MLSIFNLARRLDILYKHKYLFDATTMHITSFVKYIKYFHIHNNIGEKCIFLQRCIQAKKNSTKIKLQENVDQFMKSKIIFGIFFLLLKLIAGIKLWMSPFLYRTIHNSFINIFKHVFFHLSYWEFLFIFIYIGIILYVGLFCLSLSHFKVEKISWWSIERCDWCVQEEENKKIRKREREREREWGREGERRREIERWQIEHRRKTWDIHMCLYC